MIVIDTLRADRLGANGNPNGLTPFLDSLAQRGSLFKNAYAQSSWTNPSVATLMTSRYPSQHHVASFWAVLGEDEVTLAEVLQQHGYATGAFIANFLLRKDFGFAQGFDQYQTYSHREDDDPEKPRFVKERAERIDHEALAWLDQLQQHRARAPVFLYMHYMEPHNPYSPDATYLDRVLDGRPRPERGEVNRRMLFPNLGVFPEEMVQNVKDLYDAEVMSLDAALRSFFSALDERRFLDNCIVVVTADHGEEFQEHGLMGHHQTLYDEVLRVPLIFLVPGHATGAAIDPIVSLTDVAPTLLDLAGVPSPLSFEGGSLRGVMGVSRESWWPFGQRHDEVVSGRLPATGVAFSELIMDGERLRPHERAVITASSKVIADVGGEREFYDLNADRSEKDPHALDPEARARLAAYLADFEAHTAGRAAPAATRSVDDDTKERMRALGYHE
jgi:arylsulfatase A-like enzyme